ncbi:hypothetical protein A9488_07570 [Bacillus cereus]|uniref:histidine phosphatase family protein n=1 Tax=Bacillus cereus TaxID=1396 RepID=UPI0008FE4C41|nr:histidine phosphatase family protein [Bacillus cereus]MCM3201848.1 histidine phosphatase family protein [Bacillus cereus]MDN4100401.1 histidine phosphatase family protein [Bacillus cereus]OJE15828.1 hypothetical protein A9488_07570 [Bacillus cereus]
MTSKFFIIRHAQAKFDGPNAPLSDTGQKQAENLAEFLSNFTDFKNDIIISSPLLRASQTAAILAARKNQTFCKDKRLEERNIGNYQGKDLLGDLKKYFTDMEHRFPNGESNGEVLARIKNLIKELKQNNHQNIFLITHRFTMTLLFNDYDKNFDFDKGIAITNPDVYTIDLINEQPKIKRLWDEE